MAQLLPFQDGALLLKQLDKCVGVARLDANGQTLWERSLGRSFFLKASGLYPGPSPDVFYLTAYASFYDRLNSQIRPDSLFVFRMDASDGSVVSTWGISADNAEPGIVFPLHLEAFEESVLFFYYRNYTAWYTEIRSDGTSSDPKGFFFGIVEEQSPQTAKSLGIRYRIRFQNDGNAATRFVRLENPFGSLLNPATFRLIETSAPVKISLTGPHALQFLFEDLALAPFAQDSAGSQGFVIYEMQTSQTSKSAMLSRTAQAFFSISTRRSKPTWRKP